MSNKLLTGALTLSILLMSSATVYSVPSQRVPEPIPTENPNAPLYGQEDAVKIGQAPDGFQRVPLQETFNGTGIDLTRNSVPTFVCSETANIDNLAFGFSFRTDGNNSGLVEHIANRIDVETRFLCSLTGAWYYLGAVEGDIDGEFSVWTGAGGLPGSMVASQIINTSGLAGGGWNFIDWSSFGLTFTDDFFLGFGTVLGSGAGIAPDDRIQAISDDGTGPPRVGVTFSPSSGGWFLNSAFWSADINFAIDAAVCCEEIPFTDCFLNTHADSYTFIFGLPSSVSCRKGFSMQYETGGFDTLLNAEVSLSSFFSGVAPDGEVVIELLGDLGGVPDPTNSLVAPITVGGVGLGADLYPLGTFGWIDYPLGALVLPPGTKYHLTCRWTGPGLTATGQRTGMGADDFQIGEGEPENFASVYFPGSVADPAYPACTPVPAPGWHNYFSTFGINPDFLMDVFTCRDEFIACELVASNVTISFVSSFFELDGFTRFAGVYPAGGDLCRIQAASVGLFGWEFIDGATVSINLDAGGVPGAAVYSEFIDTTAFPIASIPNGGGGVASLDIFPNGGLGVDVAGAYYVVLEPAYNFADAIDGRYRILLDNGSGTDASLYEVGGTSWQTATGTFGGPFNFVSDNFRCCNPFKEHVCNPGEDWPTYQHDQARTGVSNNALGDANCSLNLVWSASSDKGNQFSGSVIAGNIVYISDDGGYDARDLTTGALIWDQTTDPIVAAAFSLASGIRTQPTIAFVREDISLGGTWPGGMMTFLGTGLNKSVIGVDALTGAWVWTNKTNSPFPGLHPNTNNIKCVIFDDGFGADIVIYAAQTKVYAVLAQTGLPCPFWGVNPFVMGADNVNAVSTDNLGTGNGQVFVPTFSGAVAGNVYALDRFFGTMTWDLATVVGNPTLQAGADGLSGYIGNEGFFSGASVDLGADNGSGVIWVNSYFDADFPDEGYLYRVPLNGDPLGYSTAKSVRSRRATPVIDENQIYVPAFTKWANPVYGGGAGIFDRSTGSFIGDLDRDGLGDRQLNDNLLSCETGVDDWLISGTELGKLNFYRVGNLNTFQFSRSSTLTGFAGGQWMGGSMSTTHVIWTNLRGTTVALATGLDRPRLEIVSPSINVPVEFGTASGTEFDFGPAFTNNGCADLVMDSISLDDVAAPPSGGAARLEFSSVSPALSKLMGERANSITNAARFTKVGLMRGEAPEGADPFLRFAVDESASGLNYRAAAAFPDVVVPGSGQLGTGVTAPLFGAGIAPGDTVAIRVVIEGPAVTRGPHIFYASLHSNDPDYFLDNPADVPEVQLNAVGGCLEDTVRIQFGAAGANSTTVYNTANIGAFTGNGANDIDINGFTEGAGLCGAGLTELFGGLRGWSLTPRKIAMTGPSWDGDDYATILGDPNYCSNTCLPQLQTDVLLGSISTDQGLTYTPVFGDLAATTYIDSAQDYSDGAGGWATDNFPNVFSSDSTIGLIANETHYGAKDVASLADFRLIRIDVTNRNANDSIVDLVHWAHHDDDIGANAANTVQGIPGSAGYAYATQAGLGIAHGYVKVPSGCGYGNDVMRAAALDQPNSWWGFEAGAWYDSLYRIAHLPGNDSIHFMAGMNTLEGEAGSANDAASSYYFGGVTLAPGETKSFGIAHFVKVDCANLDPTDDAQFIGFADMVNKWAGFHRGDVNNDLNVDLADVIYIANTVAGSPNGAYPFAHLSDVNNDGATDGADISYMVDYYFGCGPCPVGDWTLALCTP